MIDRFIDLLVSGNRCLDMDKRTLEFETSLVELNDSFHPSSPGDVNLDKITSEGETGYQRAIFNGRTSILDDGRDIRWLDLELPVEFSGSSRRKCLDLVGLCEGEVPVLCELKYDNGKSHGDSPV